MQNPDPISVYHQRLQLLASEEKQLLQRKKMLAWLRFLAIILAFLLLWQLWSTGVLLAFAGFVIFFGIFLFLVVRDLKNKEFIENNKLLATINKEEIDIAHHDFMNQKNGLTFKPANHRYANDLDIFGHASVFQYINRTNSEQGNQLFAQWLLAPASTTTISQRQQAGKELSGLVEWQQQLRAYGITDPVTVSAEMKIKEWLSKENKFSDNAGWKVLRFLIPVITVSTLLLYIAGIVPSSLFSLLLVVYLAIAFGISKFTMEHYLLLDKIVPPLETLQKSIQWIENASLQSESLIALKNKLKHGSVPASALIRSLKKILEKLDYRFNPIVYIPLNTFLLWDLQQVFSLEKWKTNYNKEVIEWFNTLAEMEALSTLGTLAFNHPAWCYPVLSQDNGVFVAEELGHPLIPAASRVNNSFGTRGEKQINLVTGSNMAGKSTFLRSVGVNIVLAMAGAPVCAKKMEVFHLAIMSTMRINDNLEENTSTFYAELKKLKEIIEAVNNKEKIFLLLDEILRGTNSADRHTGSSALIKQLLKENACGLIATHDLELARLAEQYPGNLHNYHFDVQVQGEELYFDYKIKNGVCTSMNASLLMKKIGIEL